MGRGTEKEDDDPFQEELDEILQALEKETYEVKDIKRRAYPKSAASVYNQHFAAGGSKGAQLRHLQKTMRIAQQLYEGIDVKGSGTIGVITYLRTDSTRISEEADAAASVHHRELRRRVFSSRRSK